ncbi:Fur-regulated basic protein FbpA [Bacillus solimangrovi]|uniref:SLH domain-containing protein n=1 Tax=Bacillus solimangrovi TaxID=1305675 RepID=A0A1E5LF23_9BACI|nr:Fur-regulated basic protein FbpA [Bacillus solimangrovi]OEH92672.1 hypothetical protein BFG57_01310 [Bacillus solimangrovi]
MNKLRALTLAGAITLSSLSSNSVVAHSEENSDTLKTAYTNESDENISLQETEGKSKAENKQVDKLSLTFDLETAENSLNDEIELSESEKDDWISLLIDNGIFKSPDNRHLYELNEVELLNLIETI